MRQENRELGETITFLQNRVATIEGGEEPKVSSGGILGKIRDKDKHWRTATPGVTFRETKDGDHYYVAYKDPETGKTKREAVGYSYDEAIERKVELEEQAKAAA